MSQNNKQNLRRAVAASTGSVVVLFASHASAATSPAHPPIACPSPKPAVKTHHSIHHTSRPAVRYVYRPSAPVPQPVEAIAPPPPPAPMPAPVPQGPHFSMPLYDTSVAIVLPMAHASDTSLDANEQAFIDKSDCNRRGFLSTLKHPVNAQCQEDAISKTTTLVGIMRTNDDDNHKLVFIPTGDAILSVTVDVRGTHGQGWLIPFLDAFQTGVSAYTGLRQVGIAEQTLTLTGNLDQKIITGIKVGSFNSLFGSLGGCGNAVASNSTTGNVNANCVIGSTLVNSGAGQDNGTTSTSDTSTVNAGYGTGSISLASPQPAPLLTPAP